MALLIKGNVYKLDGFTGPYMFLGKMKNKDVVFISALEKIISCKEEVVLEDITYKSTTIDGILGTNFKLPKKGTYFSINQYDLEIGTPVVVNIRDSYCHGTITKVESIGTRELSHLCYTVTVSGNITWKKPSVSILVDRETLDRLMDFSMEVDYFDEEDSFDDDHEDFDFGIVEVETPPTKPTREKRKVKYTGKKPTDKNPVTAQSALTVKELLELMDYALTIQDYDWANQLMLRVTELRKLGKTCEEAVKTKPNKKR